MWILAHSWQTSCVRKVNPLQSDIRVRQILKRWGRAVRDARNDANLTQKDLAEKVGVCRESIVRLESGGNVEAWLLAAVAAELSLTLEATPMLKR